MKIKFIPLLLLSVLVLFSVSVEAYAYDFREDSLVENEYSEEIASLENLVLGALSYDEYNTLDSYNAISSQSSLDLDSAIRVYNFEEKEFLESLQTGFGKALQSNERYVWKVPVSNPLSDYAYAIISEQEDGTWGYVTVSGDELVGMDLAYIYNPEETELLISELTFDSIYITSIPAWHIDFITIVSGDDVGFIPYSVRPDLMEIENGKYYTSEEISIKLNDFSASMHYDYDDGVATSGGGGGDGSLHQFFSTASIITGFGAILLGSIFLISLLKGRNKTR